MMPQVCVPPELQAILEEWRTSSATGKVELELKHGRILRIKGMPVTVVEVDKVKHIT